MKRIGIFIFLMLVASYAFPNYGGSPFGVDRFGKATYAIGPFGESEEEESITVDETIGIVSSLGNFLVSSSGNQIVP